MTQQQEESNETKTVQVNDLNSFVQLLSIWHARAVKETEYFLSIPEGIEIELNGKSYEVKGEFRDGLICGVTAGLNNLGTLPFVAYTENAPH